jgi:type I restriction enzyme S subunit
VRDYLYYYLKSISVELKSIAMGGSTMPMLSKSDFEITNILKPDNKTLELFHKLLEPMNAIILNNSKISNAACSLKDLLLSKLATIEN